MVCVASMMHHPKINPCILQKSVDNPVSPGWKTSHTAHKELGSQLTPGDMADDEREDSSEPEPDYDDDDEAEEGR